MQGDVIGCLLHMPEDGQPHERDITVRACQLCMAAALSCRACAAVLRMLVACLQLAWGCFVHVACKRLLCTAVDATHAHELSRGYA